MKKMIMAAAAAVCLMAGTTVFAQQPQHGGMPGERPTPEQMAKRQTERMTEQLKLTDAQAKQVYDLKLAQIKEMQSSKQESMEARKGNAEKMQKILTPEQFEQYQQNMRQAIDQRRGHGPQMQNHGQKGKSCEGGKGCGKSESKDKKATK